jgi:hypothetical protein
MFQSQTVANIVFDSIVKCFLYLSLYLITEHIHICQYIDKLDILIKPFFLTISNTCNII